MKTFLTWDYQLDAKYADHEARPCSGLPGPDGRELGAQPRFTLIYMVK